MSATATSNLSLSPQGQPGTEYDDLIAVCSDGWLWYRLESADAILLHEVFCNSNIVTYQLTGGELSYLQVSSYYSILYFCVLCCFLSTLVFVTGRTFSIVGIVFETVFVATAQVVTLSCHRCVVLQLGYSLLLLTHRLIIWRLL